MRRRDFLQSLVVAGTVPGLARAAGATPTLAGAGEDAAGENGAAAASAAAPTLYIPGYWPGSALTDGQLADQLWRKTRNHGHDAGKLSLLTRIDASGAVTQAVFPVKGHDVAIAPDRRTGFFGRMDYGAEAGAAHHVAFDPLTLEETARGRPLKTGWRGGGHGVYAEDGSVLYTSERVPLSGYRGHPDAFYGRIAVRDPQTLAVIDSIPCHGIDPHEIRLLPGGRAAVANYGSVAARHRTRLGVPRDVVEASVTIIELASGNLIEKHLSSDPEVELRHLTVMPDGRVFAIRARVGKPEADRRYLGTGGVADEADLTADSGECFLPAAPLLFHAGTPEGTVAGDATVADLMRHGLSVKFDADHAEVIATFPSAQRVMVFDAENGALKRAVDTSAFGLRYPSGLTLLPDGIHYAVAGYWQGLYVFTRGTHALQRELCHYPMLFGHSHMTAV